MDKFVYETWNWDWMRNEEQTKNWFLFGAQHQQKKNQKKKRWTEDILPRVVRRKVRILRTVSAALFRFFIQFLCCVCARRLQRLYLKGVGFVHVAHDATCARVSVCAVCVLESIWTKIMFFAAQIMNGSVATTTKCSCKPTKLKSSASQWQERENIIITRIERNKMNSSRNMCIHKMATRFVRGGTHFANRHVAVAATQHQRVRCRFSCTIAPHRTSFVLYTGETHKPK